MINDNIHLWCAVCVMCYVCVVWCVCHAVLCVCGVLCVQRELFTEGHRLFYAQDWETMVATLEKSLVHFYKALDECKTLCDDLQTYDSTLEFPQVGVIWRWFPPPLNSCGYVWV